MSRRKPLAALLAVMAALAIAVPVASASTATTAPAAHRTVHATRALGGLMPGSLPCLFLYNQARLAFATGNPVWASFASQLFVSSGCGGAAI